MPNADAGIYIQNRLAVITSYDTCTFGYTKKADMVYFSCKTLNNVTMLAELGFRPGTGTCSISLKSAQGLYMPLLAESLQKILRS